MSQPPAAASAATGGLPAAAYADAFVRGPPRESVSRVQGRLHKAKVLTDELAEYFAARRELENAYLKALAKISKRQFLSDPTALGSGFLPVYERLVAEIAEVASVHGELETKIEQECEIVMRSASNRGEWGRIKEHDDSIASTLREINTLEQQLAKDQKKVEGASSKKASAAQDKLQETERALAQTMDVWETEAPFAFEAYQRIDAQRLDLLRETVAKFETAQSDAAQRLMSITEQTMQVALNFDTQAEMTEFMLKNGTATRSAVAARSSARAAREQTPVSRSSAAPESRGSTPARTVDPRTNGSTMLGGSRAAGASTTEFGAQQSSSASIHSATGNDSTISGGGGRGSTLKNALSRFGRQRSNKDADRSTMYGSLPERAEPMSPPSAPIVSSRPPQLTLGGQSGGSSRRDENASGAGLIAPLVPSVANSNAGSQPSTLGHAAVTPQVDSEGFSIPPPDRKPWEAGGAGALPGASLMDDDDQEEVSDLPKVTGMNIASKPVSRQDSEEEQAALERMRSTLLTARAPPTAPSRRNTTRRDRRDVRNTTYGGGMNLNLEEATRQHAPSSDASGAASPITPASAFTGAPGLGAGRTQSIVSMSSMSAAPGNPFDAGAAAQGLRASITETVNVIFAGGAVSRLMVVGEVAVSLRDLSSTDPLHLRLDAFEQLEKVAPNPAFLQPIGAERPGEYRFDVGALLAQGGGSAGQATLLKYQLYVSESRQREYIPLDVSAQWRCEAQQTSFLCNYKPNAESRLATQVAADGDAAAELQDVSFVISVQPSNVAGQMSKPTGNWNAEHKRMYWRLDEPLAVAAAQPGKVLARFQVDAPSTPSAVQVRWRAPGRTLSSLGLSVVEGSSVAPSALRFDAITRTTMSGKYVANP